MIFSSAAASAGCNVTPLCCPSIAGGSVSTLPGSFKEFIRAPEQAAEIRAKQNRILNLTILVGGGKKLLIPVSCVKQGRWSYRSRDFRPARKP